MARCSWYLLLMISGSFIYEPMDTGFSQSSAVTSGAYSPTKARTSASSSKTRQVRFWWLVKNPSKATITGSLTASAIFSAHRFISYTAWGSPANRITQPVLSAYMISEWSPLMDSGPDTVRHATFITIGNRVPDWTGSCSSAYRRPLAEVALNTRPPPVDAP